MVHDRANDLAEYRLHNFKEKFTYGVTFMTATDESTNRKILQNLLFFQMLNLVGS
jgi:hypothetical protein